MNILFAGTPAFAARFLEALVDSEHTVVGVITQPDKPGKRGKKPVASPVKSVAVDHSLTILQPDKLTLDCLEGLAADLMIVVAYGQILRQPVLDFPRYGCVNVHASLLPRWRGAAPIQRALLAGDHETGVGIMQMDAGLDTGDVLQEARFTIGDTDTAESLFERMTSIGIPLLLESLGQIEAGTHEATPQPQSGDTYARKISKEEAALDWHSAIHTDRQVRAFYPDPIAYCFLDNKRIRIHSGRPVETVSGAPGEILEVSRDGVLVGCGADSYLIERLQLPLGKGSVIGGSDVLNGYTKVLYPGLRLTAEPL